jgi:uncharacterized protein (AIM24 family)
MMAEAMMVQIRIVEITVIMKYLKGNFTGIGLKEDFAKERRFLKKFKYHGTGFEVLFKIIINLKIS